jgi:hypothetical protein
MDEWFRWNPKAVRNKAIGDTSKVLVREVVCERHLGTELLEASLALVTGPVRVDHAADRGEVAGLELRDRRTDVSHTTCALEQNESFLGLLASSLTDSAIYWQ